MCLIDMYIFLCTDDLLMQMFVVFLVLIQCLY